MKKYKQIRTYKGIVHGQEVEIKVYEPAKNTMCFWGKHKALMEYRIKERKKWEKSDLMSEST